MPEKTGRWLLRVTAGLTVALLAIPAVAADQADAAATVEAREIAFAATMADRDIEAFARFISPEAIFFDGNAPIRGREAIVEAWTRFFEGPAAPFSWRPDLVQVLDSGTLALSSGPVYTPDGEIAGRFNTIWRKDPDGIWRVVFDKGS